MQATSDEESDERARRGPLPGQWSSCFIRSVRPRPSRRTMTLAISSIGSFETLAIHAGLEPDPTTGAILTPIHQSTTYVQSAVGVDKGFTYSRSGNPTVAALERNLGALDGAPPAVAFSTGMSALTALF